MAVKSKLAEKLYSQIEAEISKTQLSEAEKNKICKAKVKAMAKIVSDLTADLDCDAKTQVDPYIANIKIITKK